MVTLSHRPTAASLCCKTSSPPVSRGWVAVPYIVIAAVVFFAVVATTAAFRHHGTWPVVLGVLPRRRFSADRPPASSLLLVPSPLPLPSPSPSLVSLWKATMRTHFFPNLRIHTDSYSEGVLSP